MAESMLGLKRTCRCAELNENNIGQTVTVMGWVAKQRNKGGLVFVDLRDRSGILQLIYEETECGPENFAKAEKMRAEFVVAAVGTVCKREAVNPNIATGAIEIRVKETRILSESETPPFHIVENSNTKEDLRLKYRSLDLRRPDMQRRLILRSQMIQNMGLSGDRDADPLQVHTRGSERLSGPQPRAPRKLLRASAVSPAVQTAPDVLRF